MCQPRSRRHRSSRSRAYTPVSTSRRAMAVGRPPATRGRLRPFSGRDGVLLINHPPDCPTCDSGGRGCLQDYYPSGYGSQGVAQRRARAASDPRHTRSQRARVISSTRSAALLRRRCARFTQARDQQDRRELRVFGQSATKSRIAATTSGRPTPNNETTWDQHRGHLPGRVRCCRRLPPQAPCVVPAGDESVRPIAGTAATSSSASTTRSEIQRNGFPVATTR